MAKKWDNQHKSEVWQKEHNLQMIQKQATKTTNKDIANEMDIDIVLW